MGPEIKSRQVIQTAWPEKTLQELRKTSVFSRHIAKVQIRPLKQPEVHH